jgi:hypothetical protein
MKMYLFFLAVTALFFSCNTSVSSVEIKLPEKDSVPFVSTQPMSNSFADSLKIYFDFPVDFYALKKETMHMHSGSSRDFKEEYFRAAPDSTFEFYAYWAIEFDLKNDNGKERSLLFATWKPWQTAKQKNYETDNEILVGIQSKLAWEGLRQSNFVGKKMSETEARFGEAHVANENCRYYMHAGKILILHEKNDTVDWFKYFWLHESMTEPDSIPATFFTWNNS